MDWLGPFSATGELGQPSPIQYQSSLFNLRLWLRRKTAHAQDITLFFAASPMMRGICDVAICPQRLA